MQLSSIHIHPSAKFAIFHYPSTIISAEILSLNNITYPDLSHIKNRGSCLCLPFTLQLVLKLFEAGYHFSLFSFLLLPLLQASQLFLHQFFQLAEVCCSVEKL
jgi:hypothetical protein